MRKYFLIFFLLLSGCVNNFYRTKQFYGKLLNEYKALGDGEKTKKYFDLISKINIFLKTQKPTQKMKAEALHMKGW